MGKRKEWINDFGSILESKAGKLYIKIEKDAELKAGDTIQMQNHFDSLDEGVAAGRLSEERAEEIKVKTGFVKYKLTLPPSND